MKRFVAHGVAKVGRFFWSRGFLKFVLWTVTLIVFFYIEEDWRGARAWATTEAKWEAKGETFDYDKLLPPPIPEDQNLAALPLFKTEHVSKNDDDLYPVNLERDLRSESPAPEPLLAPGNNWMRGELPDLRQLHQKIALAYKLNVKTLPSLSDPLAQFDTLYPWLGELRDAAAQRPLCRFVRWNEDKPPFEQSLALLTAQIKVSRVLASHAVLALDENCPDLALADLKTAFCLSSGVAQEPELTAGLVSLAINAIQGGPLFNGLTLHRWNDAQLREADRILHPIDLLRTRQLSFRGEALYIASAVDFIKEDGHRSSLIGMLQSSGSPPGWTDLLWPEGWLDQNKSIYASFIFSSIPEIAPEKHRVYPEITNRRENDVARLESGWARYAPWNQLPRLTLPAAYVSQTLKFAQGQVWIDQMRIACALERYRLAHGIYPGQLETLVPSYISELPTDVIDGSPYRYRLRPDGTFLLYSIGWNQKDDDGRSAYDHGPVTDADLRHGDWVWPTPQPVPPP